MTRMHTKQRIWLASANKGKQKEITEAIGKSFLVQCFSNLDVEETGHTLQENALIKARAVFQVTRENTLADDTGLEVDALNGAPGVYSARYAGEPANDQRNIEKLIKELEGMENRRARFRTCMALIWHGKEYLFEGTVEGNILRSPAGNGGFGYDPLFMPTGKDITFAQMPLGEKNAISHRGKALAKVAAFLNGLP